jgi:hypothetical protein
MGPIGCPEKSLNTNLRCVTLQKTFPRCNLPENGSPLGHDAVHFCSYLTEVWNLRPFRDCDLSCLYLKVNFPYGLMLNPEMEVADSSATGFLFIKPHYVTFHQTVNLMEVSKRLEGSVWHQFHGSGLHKIVEPWPKMEPHCKPELLLNGHQTILAVSVFISDILKDSTSRWYYTEWRSVTCHSGRNSKTALTA